MTDASPADSINYSHRPLDSLRICTLGYPWDYVLRHTTPNFMRIGYTDAVSSVSLDFGTILNFMRDKFCSPFLYSGLEIQPTQVHPRYLSIYRKAFFSFNSSASRLYHS